MIIPRWIKDSSPDESIESRIENLLNRVVNSDYISITDFMGYIASELIAILNKIQKEKNIMPAINHYGKRIDSDNPVTGVYSIHDLNWGALDDELCLDCESAYQDIESDNTLTEDEKYGLSDTVECDSCHTKIIGEWLKDKDDKYYPNPEGEYAAILNESTVQVVYSKYTARHGLCSPCYPGQVDMDSIGDYLGYALPNDLLYKDES